MSFHDILKIIFLTTDMQFCMPLSSFSASIILLKPYSFFILWWVGLAEFSGNLIRLLLNFKFIELLIRLLLKFRVYWVTYFLYIYWLLQLINVCLLECRYKMSLGNKRDKGIFEMGSGGSDYSSGYNLEVASG